MIRALWSEVRTNGAMALVMLAALLAYHDQILGLVCDLLGW